jgi:hypothetical protein
MDISLIKVSGDSVVLSLGADVAVEIVGEYSFSKRDPIDRDYITLGSKKVTANEEFSTDVLVTLSGDFSKGLTGVEVEEVEMTENRVRADFGELDMDWGDDDRYGGLN